MAGAVAEHFGAPLAVRGGALLALAVAALVLLKVPQIRQAR
jgi:hypothetical protein